MKVHQVEASKFLLNRLMGYTRIESATIDPSLITGAILADDMGTGKVIDRPLYPIRIHPHPSLHMYIVIV